MTMNIDQTLISNLELDGENIVQTISAAYPNTKKKTPSQNPNQLFFLSELPKKVKYQSRRY